MKGKVVFVAAMVAFMFWITSPASADFTVVYPDDTLGIEINLGLGRHAAVFWDTAASGDFDLFTFHANEFSNPLSAFLVGGTPGIAYWLNFLGTDQFGRFVFDVFVKTSLGGGFFFVTTFAF